MTLTLSQIRAGAIAPALALLPPKMTSAAAEVMLLAITQQEDVAQRRRQWPTGPARGLWQFEPGSLASRGGVWGVFLHRASAGHLRTLASARGVSPEPAAIWSALQGDDVLAAGVARLLLWTDALPLPELGDVEAAWQCYLRTWRPGAYINGTPAARAALRRKWGQYYALAMDEVLA